VIDTLKVRNFWHKPARKLDAFESLALLDCHLATEMDVLAARRALLGQQLRAGESVRAPKLTAWADDMAQLSAAFAHLWLTRNRPARLKDNLKLMSLSEADARRQAQR